MDATPSTAMALLESARAALIGVAEEGLGQEKRTRFRGERIVRVGSAWHLGVLLLTATETLATAEVLRAADAPRRGYAAESARARAQRRALALRGGFAEGEVVHIGWRVIDVAAVDAGGASGPLAMIDAVPSVDWNGTGAYRPLREYLREQLELLRGSGAPPPVCPFSIR